MPNRKVLLFAIAGVLLLIVIFLQMRPASDGATPTMTVVPAVVAKYDIPPYTILNIDHLRSDKLPASQAASAYGGIRDLVGLMTTTELRAGNVIRHSDVLAPDASMGSGDMLVYSFYVQTARVLGGQLRPGHHIDLLVTRPESRDEPAQSLWLARNVWVVGVQQASGEEVSRATPAVYATAEPARKDAASALVDLGAPRSTQREGAANLVVVITHREVARMIGDYIGAQLYEPWVYIRPEQSALQGTPQALGRIDGVVFEDLTNIGIQDRSERGLDGVTVSLYDASNALKASAKTASGGKFAFDRLASGEYIVEQAAIEGYSPVTPSRLHVYVAEGQNLHIVFGNQSARVAEAVAATPALVAPTLPAPRETPAVAAQPGTPSLRISDRRDGPEKTAFAEPPQEVWAIVECKDCAANLPYSVVLLAGATGNQERRIGGGNWSSGSTGESFRMTPEQGTVFQPGTYVTALRTGPPGDVQTQFKLWSVAGPGAALVPAGTPTIRFPNTGQDVERQR
jgi:Flp pilus assembly protein CpaB